MDVFCNYIIKNNNYYNKKYIKMKYLTMIMHCI